MTRIIDLPIIKKQKSKLIPVDPLKFNIISPQTIESLEDKILDLETQLKELTDYRDNLKKEETLKPTPNDSSTDETSQTKDLTTNSDIEPVSDKKPTSGRAKKGGK